ncbi:NCS2 family permease [Clostridium oryzae]|uniref:Guanine/hypoxanthine permease PbuG n=1 Tax=Clostridium oryzae TaxID=1450648 RepID=A0A1V4IBN5_9CLOT|nr:NCS2 family permease [Clostridium oryzae]OPJ57401.1 guanine/hypoxanthine permease PbuG [Clostridium oryzae]
MNNFFKLKENGTTVKTEVIAGLTTFVAMAYIIFVNPNILGTTKMDTGAVFVATILSAVIGTLVMGLFANAPFAQAAGMGMNAFFTYYVVLKVGLTWQQALACVFICGIINIIITLTKIRIMIINAIPDTLKNAIGAGIGLFIAFVGLIDGKLVVQGSPMVDLGKIIEPAPLLTVIGLIITIVLMVRKVRGSIFLGIILTTLVGLIGQLGFGIKFGIAIPEHWTLVSAPPSLSPTLLKLDFPGLFSSKIGLVSVIVIIISFSLVDTFDTIGTFIGTSAKTGIFDEKNDKPTNNGLFPRKLDRALFADATATSIGALLGTSNVTTYVESTAGISEGGRTGLTSVVTAICFLLALFFSPIVSLVPSSATAPALIIVGVLMVSSIARVDLENFEEAAPAFLTFALMPFTYSISNGIAAGFIFYVLVKIVAGKAKKVHPIMYIFAILFILKFILS